MFMCNTSRDRYLHRLEIVFAALKDLIMQWGKVVGVGKLTNGYDFRRNTVITFKEVA